MAVREVYQIRRGHFKGWWQASYHDPEVLWVSSPWPTERGAQVALDGYMKKKGLGVSREQPSPSFP